MPYVMYEYMIYLIHLATSYNVQVSKLDPLHSPVLSDKSSSTEEYDYGSDSDLGDEVEAFGSASTVIHIVTPRQREPRLLRAQRTLLKWPLRVRQVQGSPITCSVLISITCSWTGCCMHSMIICVYIEFNCHKHSLSDDKFVYSLVTIENYISLLK